MLVNTETKTEYGVMKFIKAKMLMIFVLFPI